jgi:hypothetical protein
MFNAQLAFGKPTAPEAPTFNRLDFNNSRLSACPAVAYDKKN